MLTGALEHGVPAASGVKEDITDVRVAPCSYTLHGFHGVLLHGILLTNDEG